MKTIITSMALCGTVSWAAFSIILLIVCMLGFANDKNRRLDWLLLSMVMGTQSIYAGILIFSQLRYRLSLFVPEIWKNSFVCFTQPLTDIISLMLLIPILICLGKAVTAAFSERFENGKDLSECCSAFIREIYNAAQKTESFFTSVRRLDFITEEEPACEN